MSTELSDLLIKALLTNSFDDGVMSTNLKNTFYNSFSYLHNLQLSEVGYEELCYFSGNQLEPESQKYIGKLYLDKLIRACFDVDYDLIHVSDNEAYRKSDYYLKEYTFQDMVYHPEIFLKMPIVIIDDKAIWDYKLKSTKDCTTFILPYKRNFVIKDEYDDSKNQRIYQKHKIQILIVDNRFYNRYTYNQNTINLDDKGNFKFKISDLVSTGYSKVESDTNAEFIKKYKVSSISSLNGDQDKLRRNTIAYRKNIVTPKDKIGVMFCSFHIPNSAGNDYELGTILVPMTLSADKEYYEGTLTSDLLTLIKSTRINFYVSIVFVEGLIHHKFYTGNSYTVATDTGADLMVLQANENTPYSCPIPVENFMIFKKKTTDGGFILERNDKMISLHYPNIYQFTDINMKKDQVYDAFYFYYDMPELKYTCLFDFYFQFLYNRFGDYGFEKLINDIYYKRLDLSKYTQAQIDAFYDVFKKIYDYKYYHHLYGETDFLYRYIKTAGHEDDTPFDYKVNTYKEWIKIEPWVLRDYVLEQDKLGSSYHLFTNTLDLKDRIRNDTSKEFGNDPLVKFTEPMYVFAFNNEKAYPELLDLRVFVDGLNVGEIYLHHDRKLFMDYFYIPTRLVSNDSYIEIEVFPQYKFNKEITFSSLKDEVEISLLNVDKDIFPTYADLFYKTADEGYTVDPTFFTITKHTNDCDIVVESFDEENEPIRYTQLDTFTIKPTDELILNRAINLRIRKYGEPVNFMVEQDCSYLCIKFVANELNHNFAMDYFRIYYDNGRLVPRCKYQTILFDVVPYLFIFQSFKKGDIINIDFTPYHYREVFYQEELSPDTQLIDLSKALNKPFDIRYYDLYLNGRKLSINNVFTISPTSIALVNINTIYNLDIYEKERDWEYFGLDYTEEEGLYYFSFEDLVKSGALTKDDRDKLIKSLIDMKKDSRLNIYPNKNTEEKQDRDTSYINAFTFQMFYFNDLIPKTFENPDVRQESTFLLENNFHIISDYFKRTPCGDTFNHYDKVRKGKFRSVIELDPDKIIESSSGDHETMAIYSVGHLNEVEQDILDQEIVVKDEPKIVSGMQFIVKSWATLPDTNVTKASDGSDVVRVDKHNVYNVTAEDTTPYDVKIINKK